MFVININNKVDSEEFEAMVNNITKYALDASLVQDLKIIRDNSSVEIISGKEPVSSDDSEIIIEMTIRKRVIINNSDFRDKAKLDRHLFNVREFCKEIANIEDKKYIPIIMRSGKK